jgi:DNA-binding phage protein
MNQMTDETGPSFLDAFCTILIQEHRGSKMSLAQWARASQVELRSLKFLREGMRAIRCEYAVRLCCGLRLSFDRVLREAIQLKFKTPDGKRCAWKCQLISDSSAHDLMPARDARAFAAALCSALARQVADSGKNFSELAMESGMERTVISRLNQPGRQNPSLQSLYELSCAVGCQLDVQARKVASALQPSQGK